MNHHHIAARAGGAEVLRRAGTARAALPADASEVERIVRAAAAGEDAAWSALVRRFTPLVRNVARAYRLTAADADDVVQATWLKVFRHISRMREPAKFGAWLHRTAQRESLRLIGAARRHAAMETREFDEPAADDAACPLESAERSAALARALRGLPARQRGLMQLLVSEEQLTYEEIAAALDMPIGSIGPTRSRCFERLRRDPQFVGLVASGA